MPYIYEEWKRHPESHNPSLWLLKLEVPTAHTFESQVVIEDGDTDFVVDIVGTEGETFNVSTTLAVFAACTGARVNEDFHTFL